MRITPPATAPLTVNHSGQFPSVTLSFNLDPGVALGDAVQEISQMEQRIGLPATIHGSFSGTAEAYQQSLAGEPMLIGMALVAVYIVLGIFMRAISPDNDHFDAAIGGSRRGIALLLFRIWS